MNILLIGNGFDLAHGLPTKYTDFLEFVKMFKTIKEKNIFNDAGSISKAGCNVDNKKLHKAIRLTILYKANNSELEKDSKELLGYIDHNFWIDYFLQCPMYQKENWIDFEGEIKDVIESFDNNIHNSITKIGINDEVVRNKISNEFLRDYFIVDMDKLIQGQNMVAYEKVKDKGLTMQEYSDYINKYREENPIQDPTTISYKAIIEKLEKDLNRLILALEIYLYDYVEKIEIKQKSPDINEIITGIGQNDMLKIISFNYTHTCEKLYQKKVNIKEDKTNYDYLHGETLKPQNNMVLGIDEYLPSDRENKDIEFIAFKKYFQRIFKGTGCRYRDWVDIILSRKEKEKNIRQQKNINEHEHIPFNYFNKDYRHMLYIFGHSLDMTDKDVLRDLILNDNVKTVIFYLDSDDLKSKVANLVKVIHQDELIRRTGGSAKTIEFRLQKDMVDIGVK